MSRGFVKEDDQEETPIIPPRAALPEGVINYVTPPGLASLKKERDLLEQKIATLAERDERERRRTLAVLNGRLNLLRERIQTARVLAHDDNLNEVRFGAQVTYRIDGNPNKITIQITGVDEADVKQHKIAFIAPIAKALNGKKVGEETPLQLGNETRLIQIVAVAYH